MLNHCTVYDFHNKTDILDLEPPAPSGPTHKSPQQVEVKRGSRGGTDSTKGSGTVSTEERGEGSQPPQPSQKLIHVK